MVLESVDRAIVQALELDGRAPFRLIGDVLGVSESTVARRYRRMRAAGVLRVVGSANGMLLGYTSWTLRIRCMPDAANAIAAALARRPDTYWVHVLSGGTEISCNLQARNDAERDVLLMDTLPRTSRVLDVSAHALLGGAGTGWGGLDELTDDQVDQLRRPAPEPAPVQLTEHDRALLAVLARDGRTTVADLAAITAWSESSLRRRIELLRHHGVLVLDVDLPAAAIGHRGEARLWITVAPAQLMAVAQALGRHPETSFVGITTGPTNVVAAVVCRDNADLLRYLTERVSPLPGIHSVETAPVIRTVKRAGAPLPR
ncbi:AsnC family transcriptional regulator [Pseudonocardia sp. TRM90224]|uniref:AsnC family transcriptional regulator n=1 Tax=Pseudonocardia sp. TRM90224 TaxID=2812678 RepID=UPI001E56AD00|nr:AsnC family transcriptional regulator [Pseudonocardia sp. TRM90224]